MAHIDLQKYFVEKGHGTGRPRYDREKLLMLFLIKSFNNPISSSNAGDGIGSKRINRSTETSDDIPQCCKYLVPDATLTDLFPNLLK